MCLVILILLISIKIFLICHNIENTLDKAATLKSAKSFADF